MLGTRPTTLQKTCVSTDGSRRQLVISTASVATLISSSLSVGDAVSLAAGQEQVGVKSLFLVSSCSTNVHYLHPVNQPLVHSPNPQWVPHPSFPTMRMMARDSIAIPMSSTCPLTAALDPSERDLAIHSPLLTTKASLHKSVTLVSRPHPLCVS